MNEIVPTTDLAGSPIESPLPVCKQCNQPFAPRAHTGGRAQKFCSETCRRKFHSAAPTPPTPDVGNREISPPQPAPETRTSLAPEGDLCWAIPAQSRIECSATNDDEVEIEEFSDLDESENSRIVVCRGNAVRLARCILFAAGFPNISISTLAKGGYHDVEDGALSEQFRYGTERAAEQD